MNAATNALGTDGLRQFLALQADAVSAVTKHIFAAHGPRSKQYGAGDEAACREDLTFHLEFLRPVLEFGLQAPMTDYLCWQGSILAARGVPSDQLEAPLNWLAQYFVRRMDPPGGTIVGAALKTAWADFQKAKAAPPPLQRRTEHWLEATAFEAALLSGHQSEALAVMNNCIDMGRSLVDFERHVIQPSLYHIGEKWQAGEVTVSQEHMATAIVQAVMTAGLLRSPPPALIGKRVLLACVAGNHHAIGLRMVCDAFQLAGWDVQYLGADVPTEALIGQVAEWKPDLVALSASFAQHLLTVKDVIMQVRERLGSARPAVIVGGLAINRFGSLAAMVGADAQGADAPAAVLYATASLAA
jgi:methanogenic corrinoid protein MtbC1